MSAHYSTDPVLARPGTLIQRMFRDLIAARELGWQLAVRDIRAQYRQTALGYLWIFILPAANTAVWLFMKSAGVVKPGNGGLSYPAFLISGTIIWSIFMDAVNAPLQQATAAKPMLAKINFPREALILSGIYQTSFNAAIRVAVLIVALLALGVAPTSGLIFAPLAMLSVILAGTTLGIAITPVGMLYTDVGRTLPLLLQFLMFLSPVVYAAPANGITSTLIRWNPLTPLIQTTRDTLTGLPINSASAVLAISACLVTLLFLAWAAYRLAIPILIERMSA